MAGLPYGWKLKESRSRPGVVYYITPEGKSQWTLPTPKQVAAAEAAKAKARGSKRSREDSSRGSGKRAKKAQVRASHILVKHAGSRRPASWRQEGPITRSEDEALARLVALRKQVVDAAGAAGGDADAWEKRRAAFAKVAETESDCSSHKRGGDLGFFLYEKMDPAFSAAAFALEPFAISEAVKSASGVHIILRSDDPSEPDEVHCLHLLKKHTGSRNPMVRKKPVTRSLETARLEVSELREALAAIPAASLESTFREFATSESDCSSSRKGGDLGPFGRGKMQPPFEKAAFALKVGELSGLVESPSGVHIILRVA